MKTKKKNQRSDCLIFIFIYRRFRDRHRWIHSRRERCIRHGESWCNIRTRPILSFFPWSSIRNNLRHFHCDILRGRRDKSPGQELCLPGVRLERPGHHHSVRCSVHTCCYASMSFPVIRDLRAAQVYIQTTVGVISGVNWFIY